LSSDYFYPAMARAALILAGRGVLDLPHAWALISANPASATGLTDRGTLERGKRADIVVVDPATSRAVLTVAQGRIAHLTAAGASRLG
jgi:alpha-D-ribose 1-methylphosphonate 5-triphosphate diphosphatase